MSLSKRYFEHQMEEGCHSNGGYVCAACFTDGAIQEFIKANVTECKCSYCGRKTKKKPIAADMDEVLSFISEGLAREYDIPENCLPYDSAEGGWLHASPQDPDDVFMDLDICSEGSHDLLGDLVRAFSDRQFVQRDPLVLSESDGFKYSWRKFCEHTKHDTRFVFFKVKTKRRTKNQLSYPDDDSPPFQILLDTGEMVKSYRLIKTLPMGTKVVRARQHEATVACANAKDLGSPPQHKASQSRMSPAGIPMFYGAADKKTAFLEVFDEKARSKNGVTFGNFVTTRPLKLLDLTDLPAVPSIFDVESYPNRPPLLFLRHFQIDISKPVERDGREHYEYVPTQIMAEYFRRVYREGRKRVDGIMFNSSHNSRGICYCIFATAEACTDGPNTKAEHLLMLESHRTAKINFRRKSFR